MAITMAAPTSYHRIASRSGSRLSDWQDAPLKTYSLRLPRPRLTLLNLEARDGDEDKDSLEGEEWKAKDHRSFRVRSIIDTNAWDQARWSATAYVQLGACPGIAFVFGNATPARKIFERWRERFGAHDANEDIYLAIVQNLPDENPYHYRILVTSKFQDGPDSAGSIITSRSMTMTPDDATNLRNFLDAYRRVGEFFILPGVIENGELACVKEVALLKRQLSVKDAAEVGKHDPEAMALGDRFTRTGS
jgi:hypothetical protein